MAKDGGAAEPLQTEPHPVSAGDRDVTWGGWTVSLHHLWSQGLTASPCVSICVNMSQSVSPSVSVHVSPPASTSPSISMSLSVPMSCVSSALPSEDQ